jgi:serpin B
MSDNSQGVFINNILHESYIDVTEQGCESTASTGVIMTQKSVIFGAQPILFKCDRPFLFVIHDNRNGGVLFVGRYSTPE